VAQRWVTSPMERVVAGSSPATKPTAGVAQLAEHLNVAYFAYSHSVSL